MHQIRIDDPLSWLFYKPFFHELHSALIIHLHRVTKNRLNPKEHQSPKYTHRICRKVREVRSSTNLVSSYRTTKKSISFYFFARRHQKGIQQFYMFICLRKGRNPSFGTDVQLVSFGSAAAIRAL